MLEQRIKNLENQVGKLTVAIERLTEVLTSDNPPPALATVKPIKDESSKPEAVEKPEESETQEAAEVAKEPETKKPVKQKAAKKASLEDARKALVQLATAKGKDAAKGVLAEFDAAKMGDLDESQYQEVIDLANKVASDQEAA